MTAMTFVHAQPREKASGRFAEKSHAAPETALITEVPFEVPSREVAVENQDVIDTVPLTSRPASPQPMSVPMAVPEHLRAQPNPLLDAFEHNRAEYGDTPQRWAQAIDDYFDGDTAPRDDDGVYSTVRETVGTPREEGDVAHWTARTAAWRDHALATLAETD